MRRREVPLVLLVLLALVLCLASRGSAAPVTVGRATALTKMYPRGNHWAVGHLMGKKRADSPQLQEEDSLKEQLREYVQWEEATKNLLSLLQAKAARGHQPPPQEPLSFHQPAWDSEDVSSFKDAGSRLQGTVNMPGSMNEGRNPQLN
nr:gastrin-releasing peptide isoform X1 [Odocoileus virginianus texanus]